jgi:DNA-binding NarL/FixJ family response regulator
VSLPRECPANVCRALRVLCAASPGDRLAELKWAAASAHWEVVGGAASLDELLKQIGDWGPDVVIIDASMGTGAVRAVRAARPQTRIVTLGAEVAGGDAGAESMKDVARTVLGLPRTGGPVQR